MRCLSRVLFGLIALALLLVALGLAIQWGIAAFGGTAAAEQIEARSGFPAEIDEVKLRFIEGLVEVDNARVFNPPEWPEREFVELKQFLVKADPFGQSDQRLVVEELVIHLGTLGYITNEQNQNNARTFVDRVRPPEREEPVPEEEAPPPQYLIKRLVVRLDDVRMADYSGAEPRVRDINADMNIEMTDVTDFKEALRPVAREFAELGISEFMPVLFNYLRELDIGGMIPSDLMEGPLEEISTWGDAIPEEARGLIDTIIRSEQQQEGQSDGEEGQQQEESAGDKARKLLEGVFGGEE